MKLAGQSQVYSACMIVDLLTTISVVYQALTFYSILTTRACVLLATVTNTNVQRQMRAD